MQDLTITCVQTDLKWQDKAFNLAHIESLLLSARPESDLIVLPEMFSTGFSMESALLAEEMDGPTVRWMKDVAQEFGRAVCGSLIIRDGEKYYNRFIWIDDRQLCTYDKRHLFSLLGEEKPYTAGDGHTAIEYRGWTIQPFICYDLRFPAWCRLIGNAGLQLYVANWPERRIAHWRTLLQARAIENQCYTAGVNRVGDDANGVHHTGDSAVYDPFGRQLALVQEEEKVFTVMLTAGTLQKCREKFPFLDDRDQFDFR